MSKVDCGMTEVDALTRTKIQVVGRVELPGFYLLLALPLLPVYHPLPR